MFNFNSDFRQKSLRAFLTDGPKDVLDVLALNCMLVQWCCRQIQTQVSVTPTNQQVTQLASRHAATTLNMLNHVKFYEFLAENEKQRLQFVLLRKIPQPQAMRTEAHLKAGMQLGATVELLARCEGIDVPGGLSPDSIELTEALGALGRDLLRKRSTTQGSNGQEVVLVDLFDSQSLPVPSEGHVIDWELRRALQAYAEVAALGEEERPGRIDIRV